MKRKNIIIIGFIIILLITGIVTFTNEEKEYISYKDFIKDIELNLVESVEIGEKEVYIKKFNDDKLYFTDNPETNDFKEYLLLNDVVVNDALGSDTLTYILDASFYLFFYGVIIFGCYKLISISNKTFKIIRKNKTKFSDIAGMEEVKKDMLKTVEILKSPEIYKQKGIRAPKGIILEGPPGNGKTLFARALAGEANINFIPSKGADFQSAMMSVGPAKIKMLFKKARKNKPCIIFIDEFDGIGEKRNYTGTGIDKENNRIITAMLNEMDGFANEEGVLVIAATNSYTSLDPALIRPGRFDKKFKVGNPDNKTILELIDMYTKNKGLDTSVNKEILSKCFEKLSCAAIETVLNEAAMQAEVLNKEKITIEDIIEAGKKTNTVNIQLK